MTSLQRLNAYLRQLEWRLRLFTISRGAALVAAAAMLLTLLFVWIANQFAFAARVVLPLRILLFLVLATGISLLLIVPLMRLNRRWVARNVESRVPGFNERLLTLVERQEDAGPFTELLADDALRVAAEHQPWQLNPGKLIAAGACCAAIATGILVWMIAAGPGYVGYGASLLWTGAPRSDLGSIYNVSVRPGDATVRRKGDQLVSAHVSGFSPRSVALHVRSRGTPKWEQVPMQPQRGGNGYEFLLAGVSDSLDYYVEAGMVRSKQYSIGVKDLPGVKRIRVTVHSPSWLQLKDVVDDPGGDVRATQGSDAEIAVLTDRPLDRGTLVMDDGSTLALEHGEGNWSKAKIHLEKDGSYHVAAIDGRDTVRITEDYFIEAKKDEPPSVKIAYPGRDPHVSPIEELPVSVQANDDFGLRNVELHYSVNGGPEQTRPLLKSKDKKETEGKTTLYLEDFKLVPGDVVSLYATARDARTTSKTDIVFAQAEPFDLTFRQSQQSGGGMQGGAGDESSGISERQKEVIAATWNVMRNEGKDRKAAQEQARFLSDVERKLSDQAKTLADRMRARELADASAEFQGFSKEMDRASDEIRVSAEQLKPGKFNDAFPHEQKALQSLLRAESMFRDIQVAFGQRGGGGGMNGSAGRDLERMFDLELDTDKNQYETGESASSAGEQQKALDEALQRLQMLAKRQQELAAQKQQQAAFSQRWEEEMLRREAEKLQQQMQKLAQNGSNGRQSNQQSSNQQASNGQQSEGQPSSSSQSAGGQSSSSRASRQQNARTEVRPSAGDPRIQQAMDALRRAEDDMRKAVSEHDPGAEQRAASELQQAQNLLSGMAQQRAGDSLADAAQRAQQLAQQQEDFAKRLKQAFPENEAMSYLNNRGLDPRSQGRGRRSFIPPPIGTPTEQSEKLAAEKDRMAQQLEAIERQMQDSARSLAASQPDASSKLRNALSEAEQGELSLRMKKNAEFIRQGYAPMVTGREEIVTMGLAQLSQNLKDARDAVKPGSPSGSPNGGNDTNRALAAIQQLRQQLEARAGQPGQQAGTPQGTPNGPGGSGQPAIDRGAVQEALRELSGVQQRLGPRDRQFRSDVGEALRYFGHLNYATPGLLDARLNQEVLPALERLELDLQRQTDQQSEGSRTTAPERVPEQYRDSVAEYFRRLSK